MHESQLWESPVLQSVLPVVEASQHVRISEEAIRRVAGLVGVVRGLDHGKGGGVVDSPARPDTRPWCSTSIMSSGPM